jgi:hypothetical protein
MHAPRHGTSTRRVRGTRYKPCSNTQDHQEGDIWQNNKTCRSQDCWRKIDRFTKSKTFTKTHRHMHHWHYRLSQV